MMHLCFVQDQNRLCRMNAVVMPEFVPKRLLTTPLVVVRVTRGRPVVAFNSALVPAHRLERFSHVALRIGADGTTADFLFGHDELSYAGSYRLSVDGGSGTRKRTPARVVNASSWTALVGKRGRYLAEPRNEMGQFVIRIHLDRPVA